MSEFTPFMPYVRVMMKIVYKFLFFVLEYKSAILVNCDV